MEKVFTQTNNDTVMFSIIHLTQWAVHATVHNWVCSEEIKYINLELINATW